MDKVELKILGLSYSQTQDNAYVLILIDEHNKKRLPIVIGANEAQSIAIKLENLKTPRPLTHDLFFTFAKSFNISIVEVIIYKIEEGVFYSKIISEIEGSNQRVEVDARTSDAVALATRFGCPIYTTLDVIQKAAFSLNDNDNISLGKSETVVKSAFPGKKIDELIKMLDEAIKREEYEKASMLRDEINRRSKNF